MTHTEPSTTHNTVRKMNRLHTTLLALGFAAAAMAQQTVYVCDKFESTALQVATTDDITFSSDETTINIGSTSYLLEDIDSVTFAEPLLPIVTIVYNGTTASVDVPSYLTDVTASVNGANVSITATNTDREYLYTVSGASANGSLTITGSYKLSLELAGLDLTNTAGAAIDVECGKRIDVILKDGTVNTLKDCAGGTHKAAFYTTGHPEFSGAGTLNVTGLTKHAISAKDYLRFKKSTGVVNILGAVSDGIHCGKGKAGNENNYFQMDGGTVTISGTGSDGIDADDYGCVKINGGQLTLNVTATDGTGIKCDSILTMTDGTVAITVDGELSEGIRTFHSAYFNGGTLTAKANANGSKGIKAKNSSSTTATVTGGGFLYFNGTNATIDVNGGTYTADATKCMGIRADQNFTQTAGTIVINVNNTAATGLSVKGTKTLSGGTLTIN